VTAMNNALATNLTRFASSALAGNVRLDVRPASTGSCRLILVGVLEHRGLR
jgi:hypothetical protein